MRAFSPKYALEQMSLAKVPVVAWKGSRNQTSISGPRDPSGFEVAGHADKSNPAVYGYSLIK
jgi:hypothetical protein